MKAKTVIIFICIVFASHFIYAQRLTPKFFKRANRFFKQEVHKGEIDYSSLQKKSGSLNKLVAFISKADLSRNSSRQRKAFYINAYNILLINNVINYFPIQYPLEEKGFFSSIEHAISGDTLTLNEIEDLLIKEHKDIRILFVLSSASKGSVQLADFAFKPRKLNKQFKKRIKETIHNYDYVRVMSRSSKILLVENFIRSSGDFDSKELIDLLNKYLKKPIPAGYTIDFYPANRKLNIKN